MGLIDKLDKSYVIIGLIKPFLDDKLYYITEHLDQVKVPWRVFREDDREPLIGFKWKDWIDRRRNIKNVSTVINNHKGSILSINEFKHSAAKYGINIIDEEIVNLDNIDFSLLAAKMKDKNPEIYITTLFPPSLDIWKTALIRQNISTPITGMDTLDYSTNKEMFEGSWYVSDSLINEELSKRYEQKFKKELIVTQAFFAYATLDLLIDVIEQYNEKPTTQQIITGLMKAHKQNSVVGSIKWSAERLLEVKPIVKKIVNGQPVVVEE